MTEAESRKQVTEDLKKLNVAATQDGGKLDITLLRRSARLASSIKHVPEALLDSQLAVKFTAHAREIAAKVSSDGVLFEPGEFASLLRRVLNDGRRCPAEETPENKFRLVSDMLPQKFAVPKTPVIGSFKCEDLADIHARQRRTRGPQRPAGAPTVVQELDGTEGFEEQMTKQVERIYLALRKLYEQGHEVVDYFEFVTDPDSYAETVENIFHVSFLVAQSLVTLELDEDGMPCLAYIPGTRGLVASDKAPKEHSSGKTVIVSMSIARWKQIVQEFHIKKSVIKRVLSKR
ncbi:EP300-interacting inhibitor of differentiation 3 [Galendromus occidentalis]|uniref:Non-structural maintenance of chromosomes element 4 n=1 Tax=Galendromus occidentalis TaxID=34638 RepID=A0AAJ7WGK9_9ACAR|nr:EP300-interacting inhibitor of differentiation 3 [Galendromus occidentalis]